MTATTTPAARRPTPTSRSRRHVPVAVAAWCLVVAGALHLTVAAAGLVGDPPADEQAHREAMRAMVVGIAGVDRTMWQLLLGFSLTMGVLLLAVGGLVLLALRHAPALVHGTRAALVLLLAVLVLALVTAVLLLPPPPVVLLGAATLLVAVALRHPSR